MNQMMMIQGELREAALAKEMMESFELNERFKQRVRPTAVSVS